MISACPIVVGLGNVLLGDDGVGPAVCDELHRWVTSPELCDKLPAGTRLLDGGTLGSALVPWLDGASAVVIVDAVRVPGRPGSVLVWRTPAIAAFGRDGGGALNSMVALAILGGLPREAITLIGIIPGRIQPGLGLTKPVRAAVPLAASFVAREARALTGGIA